MSTSTNILLNLWTEKKAGHGEDAPPLLVVKNEAIAVGVFDGMGGAGAATCISKYGDDYTKAYVASRVIKEEIESLFENCLGKEEISPELLKEMITNRLKQEQEAYPPKTKSMLRSKLVRDYPTTMAVVTLCSTETRWLIDSFWAGDSHCYLWTKKGFYQISKDDLEEDNDPMENLRNDATISNCICADRDFHINHKRIPLSKGPIVILSATDGCFGYFQTPMHFEDMLKRCLKKAKDEEDWKNLVEQEIQKVTGDDTSLSLVGIGFNSFDQFRIAMTNQSVSAAKKLRDIEAKIEQQKKELDKLLKDYDRTVKNGWENYKKTYMKHINEERDVDA